MLKTIKTIVGTGDAGGWYEIPHAHRAKAYRDSGFKVMELVDKAEVVTQQQALVDALGELEQQARKTAVTMPPALARALDVAQTLLIDLLPDQVAAPSKVVHPSKAAA